MLSRKMSVSDTFYPWDKNILKNMINDFFEKVTFDFKKVPKALVCPHAWYIYSWQTASYSYKLLQENLDKIPKTIILLCPSHYVEFKWVSVWIYDKLKTPFWDLEVDKDLARNLLKNYSEYFLTNYEALDKEHSLEVQLPFLKYIIKDKDFKILPLVFWDVNPFKIWEILNAISKDNRIFFIVSSDLSHYLEYSDACDVDKNTIDSFLSKDNKEIFENAEACWIYPWLSINEIANINNWKTELLKYQNSWDTAWGKDRVVGYGSLVYY